MILKISIYFSNITVNTHKGQTFNFLLQFYLAHSDP